MAVLSEACDRDTGNHLDFFWEQHNRLHEFNGFTLRCLISQSKEICRVLRWLQQPEEMSSCLILTFKTAATTSVSPSANELLQPVAFRKSFFCQFLQIFCKYFHLHFWQVKDSDPTVNNTISERWALSIILQINFAHHKNEKSRNLTKLFFFFFYKGGMNYSENCI